MNSRKYHNKASGKPDKNRGTDARKNPGADTRKNAGADTRENAAADARQNAGADARQNPGEEARQNPGAKAGENPGELLQELSGWGRYPVIKSRKEPAFDRTALLASVEKKGSLIAYGNGRSYGDSALARRIADMRPLDRMTAFDASTGLLICEAGVMLSEIIETFLPRGWFLKVTPGTRFTTVGGAIAADVHGKNHHNSGCFGKWVAWLDLMLADGEVVRCSSDRNSELFRATCGGMGLTGIILQAGIYLEKVPSQTIAQTTIKTGNLAETFEVFENHGEAPYSVAWIDCLATGRKLGRSLVILGRFDDAPSNRSNQEIAFNAPGRGLRIPAYFPGFLLNRFSISLFNKLYYAKAPAGTSRQTVGVDAFFYPLDRLRDWNRIYGRNGMMQYQFILPKKVSFQGMEEILGAITRSGMGSFLAVLKLYGPSNENYLSFPLEGYSLALDFKVQKGLPDLLDRLDQLVMKYGGRIYLAKDARMSKEVLEQGYPKVEAFRKLRKSLGLDKKFRSMQSDRLGL